VGVIYDWGLFEAFINLRTELAAVRRRLEDIFIAQLGSPCSTAGAEETVLQLVDRVSRGITELNAQSCRRHDERDAARQLLAECIAALVAVVPHVDEALRASFAEDVAALVARERLCGA
jgi:hypothetical protein